MMRSIKETNYKNIFANAARVIGLFADNGAAKTMDETEMHQAFVVNANSMGYTFGDDDRPERITKAFFASVSYFLSKQKVKKQDEATALILTDVAGNFKFAAIVQYHENEENPDEPGNWSYVMSFDPKSVENVEKTKSVKKLLFSSTEFTSIFDKVGYDVAAIQFNHSNYIFDACLLVVDTLLQVLDREAKEDEVVEIELPGYFTAAVAVEDGEKVYSLTPDGHMKEIIKDDTALDN